MGLALPYAKGVPCSGLEMKSRQNPHIGRYEILGELGRGAMGVVYKARDPKIDRLVAIKTISLQGVDAQEEGDFRQRFFLEARAVGRLSHPGIVTIFDVAEETKAHSPYIVMEYVAGESLHKLLASKGRLPFNSALQLAQELAEALDYAHTQGVVHRDIKPANILVNGEGRAKIADFGIAKLNLAHLTVNGHALGTPAYMAPEQLEGENVDGRADLFAVGVILYAMLTGHRPFQGNSAATVSFKVVNREPVPATAFDAELPPEIDYLIARAMAKDKAERYQTGREMALDLKELRLGRAPRSIGDPALPQAISTMPPSSVQMIHSAVPSDLTSLTPGIAFMRRSRVAPILRVALQAALQLPAKIGLAVITMLLAAMGLFALYRRAPISAPVVQTAPAATTVSLAKSTSIPKTEAPVISRTHKAVPTAPKITKVNRSVASTNVPQEAATPMSKLEVVLDHNLLSATMSLWIDGQLTLTLPVQGTKSKRLVVFHGVHGSESGVIPVPAGKHQLWMQVKSSDGYDQSKTISEEFPANAFRTLRIHCEKRSQKIEAVLE